MLASPELPQTIVPPPPRAMAAGIATASIALLMLGLQPLLLGTLAEEGRLTEDQIGAAATVELLALGLTSGALASLLPPARLKTINIAACVALAAANLGGIFAHGAAFVASRGCAGIAGGVLLWIAIALITRSVRPDRYSGIFLVTQTLVQAGLAAVLPMTLMPSFGANGGLGILATLALAGMAASIWLPSTLSLLPKPEGGHGSIRLPGILGLAAVFFAMGGVVGLWVFVEQLGAGAHISPRVTGLAVAAALAAQVVGGSAATVLSGRVPPALVLAVAGALNIGVVFVLGGALGGTLTVPVYGAAVVLFGFLWLFVMPFQTRLLIDVDPSRRAAMLLSGAQLLGMAAGPVVTSVFAMPGNLAGALRADAALFAAGAVFVVAVFRRTVTQAR